MAQLSASIGEMIRQQRAASKLVGRGASADDNLDALTPADARAGVAHCCRARAARRCARRTLRHPPHPRLVSADVLFYVTIGYAVLAVAAYVLTRNARSDLTATVVAVVLVLSGAWVAFQTYRVGDVGARAVWNPTGDLDYNSTAERD